MVWRLRPIQKGAETRNYSRQRTHVLTAGIARGHPLGMTGTATTAIAAMVALACSAGSATASLEEIIGPELVTAQGKSLGTGNLKGKIIGLYFSAEWCPPCRAFTPILAKFREANKADFEVVLVSGDKSAKSQQDYMTKYSMEWPAIPFDAAQRNGAFDRFGVRGIPALVVIDAEGKLLERDGRNQVTNNPENALDRWLPGRKAGGNAQDKPIKAAGTSGASALDQLETRTKDALGRGFEFLRKAQEATAPYFEQLSPPKPSAETTNN